MGGKAIKIVIMSDYDAERSKCNYLFYTVRMPVIV